MQENGTLARPYATAVFKLASAADKLDLWSEMLAFLAAITSDGQMRGIIADPRLHSAKVAELINDIGGGRFSDEAQNLVKVLAQNDRLDVCEDIQAQYEELKSVAQKRETVEVIAAYEVNPKFQQSIAEAMRRRLGCDVVVQTRIDKDLIGGVVIRAGDMMIDASLKGRLEQLGHQLA